MNRDVLEDKLLQLSSSMSALSDDIFDHPEVGGSEVYASGKLTSFLKEEGFSVETGVGGLKTAFRAVWQNGIGGPSIGLLCEYDALPHYGHGCGHHMQGPAIAGAAVALKDAAGDEPFRIVVYGTPDEEYGDGKITMLKNNCFRDIDFALMTHAGPNTTVDIKSLSQCTYVAEYHGRASHAALKPEDGRSAVDAMLLSLHGLEMLREHVRDDVRMHYAILDTSPTSNVVPEYAKIEYSLRSYSSTYLDHVCVRFEKVINGAALMTETTVNYYVQSYCKSKVPVQTLNDRIMQYAVQLDAPQIIPFREKTGSTDFANLLHEIPGSCIRVAFVPEGTPSHSDAFLAAGKSPEMHRAILLASQMLAFVSADLVCDENFRRQIQIEFQTQIKKEASHDL